MTGVKHNVRKKLTYYSQFNSDSRIYLSRHSEQKIQGYQNPQKLNNPVRIFIIQILVQHIFEIF